MDIFNKKDTVRLKWYVAVLALSWILIIAFSLMWNIRQVKLHISEMARTQARSTYEKDIIYRRWNAGHGGVYALVKEDTPSNPYLDVPERDITTPSGRVLTLINPAYMTRQAHELEKQTHGVRGHITSLNPIRPQNMADLWEADALKKFEHGVKEVSSVRIMEDKVYMRLMKPLVTEKGCLKCHAKQGYKEGDIRGGISVSIPMSPFLAIEKAQMKNLTAGHGLLLFIGLLGIGLGSYRLNKQIIYRKKAEESLANTLIVVQESNRKIMESIQYAKIIQTSLLTNLDYVKTYLPNSLLIWLPRDIVGGDIFLTEFLDNGLIIAAIDCTGHGVPGAFMTMIAVSALKRIVKDERCHDPAEILRRLNYIVKTTLRQDTEYAKSDDGLDASIVKLVNLTTGSVADDCNPSFLTFAGAKMHLYYVNNGQVSVIKGDKKSIGYKRSDLNFNFTDHSIDIESGTCFYLLSDGFTDQLDINDRRFGSRRLRDLLKEISQMPFEKQREMLLEAFEAHKGSGQRQDDVTVAGFGF